MKKLSILIALVLVFSTVAIVANAADLTNVAEGKTYTVDIGDEGKPDYGYTEGTVDGYGDGPNGVRQRLTNGEEISGVIGDETGDNGYLVGGLQTSEAVYVIDLGSSVSGIEEFTMDLYQRDSWGIGAPVSVEYLISDDNSTFTSVGTVTLEQAADRGSENEWTGWDFALELDEAQSARYVQVKVSVTNFVWSSEIKVLADSAQNPATGEAGIFGAIAILMVSATAVVVVSKKNRI